MGAIAAGANRDTVNRLFWYGYFVGMSYQIIDDILDFVSTEEKLGKPAGGDLLQGNITLPALYAMEDPYFVSKSHLYMKIQQQVKCKKLLML